jgi:DNA-binding FadR family transcriptional regulator
MLRERLNGDTLSEFLRYLAGHEEADAQLPALADLSAELGISVAGLREQLEVARALGLVDVRPRTGIRRLDYKFAPAVRKSLFYALALDPNHFEAFAELRKNIEAAFWHQAVAKLTEDDQAALQNLMARAWDKLRGTPIQIPHEEHRQLHLMVYSRLDNPFVLGIIEAYWDAYEAVGLNVYTDYNYLQEVWQYHQQMVDAICAQDFEAGYKALLDHTDLIYHRPASFK